MTPICKPGQVFRITTGIQVRIVKGGMEEMQPCKSTNPNLPISTIFVLIYRLPPHSHLCIGFVVPFNLQVMADLFRQCHREPSPPISTFGHVICGRPPYGSSCNLREIIEHAIL